MPVYPGPNRRRADRFSTDLNIQFYVTFDVQTKIDFRVKAASDMKFSKQQYPAVGKNVSVEGLCFTSEKQLNVGDVLQLDVFVPSAQESIVMEGQVKWCQPRNAVSAEQPTYETGVKILSVQGEEVAPSIFFDNVHQVMWSNVLEVVFSSFKTLAIKQKRQENNPPSS